MHPNHYCYTIALLFSLSPLIHHSIPSAMPTSAGFSLELIYRDSINSPLYPGNLTTAERLRRLVGFSKSHALLLESSVNQPQDLNVRPFIAHDSWLYMVKVGIGSAPTNVNLLLDTGASLTWTQCQPCTRCFRQEGRKYKPAASTTYHPLPCSHPLCVRPHQCINGECRYTISYMDGAYTSGALSTDHFTFASRNRRTDVIQNMNFGCSSESNEDMFSTTKIGGIMGMARRPESLPMQLADRIQHRFSYCLVPLNNPISSYLRFGTDIRIGHNAQSTPFLRTETVHYYLTLHDISVNGRRLNLPRGTFARHADDVGGFLIDTGAGLTHLISPAYEAVKQALVNYFTRFNVTMLTGSHEFGLDLCYRMPRKFRSFPSMDLHFQGANLHLERNNLFYVMPGTATSKVCLMMIPNSRFSVFGAAQQQNIRFVYDIGRQQLLFSPENCAQEY